MTNHPPKLLIQGQEEMGMRPELVLRRLVVREV